MTEKTNNDDRNRLTKNGQPIFFVTHEGPEGAVAISIRRTLRGYP